MPCQQQPRELRLLPPATSSSPTEPVGQGSTGCHCWTARRGRLARVVPPAPGGAVHRLCPAVLFSRPARAGRVPRWSRPCFSIPLARLPDAPARGRGAIAVYVDQQGGPHSPGPGTGDLIISLSAGPALRKVVAPVPAGLVVLLAPSARPVGTVISVSVASAQDWVIAGILGLSGPVGYWAAHVGQLPTAPQLHHPAADDSAVRGALGDERQRPGRRQ